jgi:asparagine synthase (glutamine-hydrolysing)
MCAISGIFQLNGFAVQKEVLRAMTCSMKHRGPDGEGYFFAGPIGLGHRRLSIIDLEGGSQPIGNEDGTVQIVFNGEIYNFIELRAELEGYGHKFKTHSDTEAIVHAYEQWGTECVNRFIGMFAFAIWDQNLRKLFLARDHLGVKPLYYIQLGEEFLFASEIKALLQHPSCPRNVDIRSLAQLFSFRYVPSPKTLFQKIQKLPPGFSMVVTPESIQTRRYWTWVPDQKRLNDELTLLEQYSSLFEDAVRLQLRSDVPLGLFLSSGIDSASLLALMRKFNPAGKIEAVTIGFEDGEQTNEILDAKVIADRFGAEHTYRVVSANEYMDYYNRYIWDLEEPVGNETAAAFYFVSSLGCERFKVALTGQGADEPWGGYPRHLGAKFSTLYGKLPRFLTDRLIPALAAKSSSEQLKRAAWSLNEPDMLTRLAKIYSFFSGEMQSALLQDWVKKEIDFEPFGEKEALRILQQDVEKLDPLTQMLYVDVRGDLPDDLLMVADKMSMANSLELRVPFLDHRLVMFIESLPNKFKIRGTQAKYLHKKALERWLPREWIYRKKKGFENPMREWMRTRMKEYIREHLLSSDAGVMQYFNKSYLEFIVNNHYDRKGDFMRQIELLLSFELWHRTFIRN